MNPYKIIIRPYVTEKSTKSTQFENKLEFLVLRSATKQEIKKAVEKIFDVKLESVNTRITSHGKHAIVKLKEGYIATDITARFGKG